MTLTLWGLQGLLALVFMAHGLLIVGILPPPKTFQEKAQSSQPSEGFMAFMVLIGWAEVLAALGLLLPMLTGIAPWLTPLAALGLVLIMVGATVLHLQRGEVRETALTVVLVLLLGVVVYGRWSLLPFV